MKTLIVEDEFTSKMQLRNFLKIFGDVDVVSTGKDAISYFRFALEDKYPYNLVCLDINLPGSSGHAILSEMRNLEELQITEKKEKAVVFMTTAYSSKENVLKAVSGSCDEFLAKPITMDKLKPLLIKYKLI